MRKFEIKERERKGEREEKSYTYVVGKDGENLECYILV